MFAAWGRLVFRLRGAVLAGSVLLFLLSICAVLRGGDLSERMVPRGDFESQRAANLVTQEIPDQRTPGSSSLLLILRSERLRYPDPRFRRQVAVAVEPLRRDRRVAAVITPAFAPESMPDSLVSTDRHAVLVQVNLRDDETHAAAYFPELRGETLGSHPDLRLQPAGAVTTEDNFRTALDGDLRRAELVSLPVSLVLLVLIFGSVVAGALPLSIGLLTIVGGIGATLSLSRMTEVNQYAVNVVTLLGLGVSIDYSLFIVSRFREHLRGGLDVEEALASTMSTAGRAVAFSGLTVGIGLSALLFFPGTFLASMGIASGIVTGLAVLYALTFLPALLAILGPRIDLGRLRLRHRSESVVWRRIAVAVMRHPLPALLPTLAVLLLAGQPFLHIRPAGVGIDQLPPGSEARAGDDAVARQFPEQARVPFTIVVRYPAGDPFSAGRVRDLYQLDQRLALLPGVVALTGPFDLGPTMTLGDYQRLYALPRDHLPSAVRQVAQSSIGDHIVVLTAMTAAPATSPVAERILGGIRSEHVPGARILVTGPTAADRDWVSFLTAHVPAAVGFVILVTLVLLFLLTGSVILPIKAVLANLLSITASFGALVWIFQDGHLHHLLGFTPQSIDPTIPILLFAAVFGLSMDYEVLLVTRIQERYQATGDNGAAVAAGLARSGPLITGAAAIMITVFAAFGLASVMLVKAVGLGLAIAVAIDATLVRALVVPSLMRLMGDANWWLPGWLRGILERLTPSERRWETAFPGLPSVASSAATHQPLVNCDRSPTTEADQKGGDAKRGDQLEPALLDEDTVLCVDEEKCSEHVDGEQHAGDREQEADDERQAGAQLDERGVVGGHRGGGHTHLGELGGGVRQTGSQLLPAVGDEDATDDDPGDQDQLTEDRLHDTAIVWRPTADS